MKPQIKIYRDNKLDFMQTYKPVIHDKLVSFGNKLDRLVVTGRWADPEQAE